MLSNPPLLSLSRNMPAIGPSTYVKVPPHWGLLALGEHSSLEKQNCRGGEEETPWSNYPGFSAYSCEILAKSFPVSGFPFPMC